MNNHLKKKYSFMYKSFKLLLVVCFSLSAFSQYYKNGMVVSAHPEASKVGVAILKQGGADSRGDDAVSAY